MKNRDVPYGYMRLPEASIYRVVLYVLAINGKMYEPTKQNNFWAGIKASPCSGDSR